MFQFTTTNVINSNFEHGYLPSGNVDLDKAHALYTGEDGSFNVKRIGNFKADNIQHVFKAEAVPGQAALAILDLNGLEGAEDKVLFRLNMYIGLTQGSNYSLYATDSYYKGKPLMIDFVWKKDATTTRDNLIKTIKKLFLNVQGDKIVDITADGETSIKISAVNEYQRFIKLDIEKLDAEAHHGMGEWEVVKSMEEDLESVDSPSDVTSDTFFAGQEGFGTYNWILHNLRLPTSTRFSYMAINEEETPIVGATYNQYTIHYCVNRGTLGSNAVGDLVRSHTTHVFYVKSDLAQDFEDILTEAISGAGLEIEEIKPHGKSEDTGSEEP